MSKVFWLDKYPFDVCDFGADWNHVGGVYIFTGLNNWNGWVPLYIGQADSFRNRIPSHEKWSLAVRRGATHVHAMVVRQEATRGAIERELILAYQPTLNVQYRIA